MTAITGPGVYDIPAAAYHADPAPEPSLSASIAKVLIGRTPRHAWMKHPRLNPGFVNEHKTEFDIGTAAHALLLEGESGVAVVDADSYRTKAAREMRDAAYAAGKTPLLPHQLVDVEAMVAAARVQLAAHEVGDVFTDGQPEMSLVWQEGGIWCRCRLDWLPEAGRVFYDYKTTTSANPDAWQRRLFDLGYDVQAAFYLRGIHEVLGIEAAEFRFVVQEKAPPYALSVVALTPGALALGEAKVHRAIEIWRDCLRADRWPGYPADICYVDAPAWEEVRWEAAKARDAMLREAGRDPLKTMLHWQAPLDREVAE